MPELFAFNERNADRIAETVKDFESGLGRDFQNRQRQKRDDNYVRMSFRNDSGETIPAYGCMRVINSLLDDGQLVFTAGKPNSTVQKIYLVNGDEDVIASGFGWGTFLWHADYVLFNDANTPAYGEQWGPESGSWKIAKDKPGFVTWGHNITDEGASLKRAHANQVGTDGTTEQVQVWIGSGSPVSGDLVEANADGYHEARVRRWSGSALGTDENCWLRLVDWESVDSGATIAVHGRIHHAKYTGISVTSSSVTKPLYLGNIAQQGFVAKGPSGGIAKGASGSCLLYNGDETSSGISKTAKALGYAIPAGTKWVKVERISGAWYVGCWES